MSHSFTFRHKNPFSAAVSAAQVVVVGKVISNFQAPAPTPLQFQSPIATKNSFVQECWEEVTCFVFVRFVALMSGSHLVLSEQLRLLQDEIALLRTSCRLALSEADAAGLVRAPKMPIDDVFLLRFLLSNGRKAATAADNLSACIRWRIQNREKIAAIHNGLPFKGTVVRSAALSSILQLPPLLSPEKFTTHIQGPKAMVRPRIGKS